MSGCLSEMHLLDLTSFFLVTSGEKARYRCVVVLHTFTVKLLFNLLYSQMSYICLSLFSALNVSKTRITIYCLTLEVQYAGFGNEARSLLSACFASLIG